MRVLELVGRVAPRSHDGVAAQPRARPRSSPGRLGMLLVAIAVSVGADGRRAASQPNAGHVVPACLWRRNPCPVR